MPRRIIGVPSDLKDKDLPQFFRGWEWINDPGDEVVIDFSRATFVAPWAIAQFAAYAAWLREVRGKRVEVWIDETSESGRYLSRLGFDAILSDSQATFAGTARSRLVRISKSDDIPAYASSVMDVMAIDDEEMAGAVKYVVVELLRNVVQHAKSRIGGIAFATYLPTVGLAEFAVADTGRGIRASLGDRYPEVKTDFAAVRWAVLPHVSGTFAPGAYQSMADNAGLGLFFIKEIVSRGCGSFFLASGGMMADYWGNLDGSPGKQYIDARAGGWRGTFALVQLRRDRILEWVIRQSSG
jgi:hypothetical protein